MKRIVCLMLAFLAVLSLCACDNAGSESSNPQQNGSVVSSGNTVNTETKEEAASVTKKASLLDGAQSVDLGSTISLSFGNLLVTEIGFAEKAEAYIMVSKFTSKSTVNGVTTEQVSETRLPGYLPKKDDYILFALKGIITNTTSADISMDNITFKAFFAADAPRTLNVFTNKPIDDPEIKTIPAGSTIDILFYTTVPILQFEEGNGALIQLDDATFGIPADRISYYASMGFEEGDGTTVSREQLLLFMPEATETPAVAVEEPAIESTQGQPVDKSVSASGTVEGKAVKIENVQVGFSDQLSGAVTSSSAYTIRGDKDKFVLSDSETYAVIQFSVTNLTKEEIKIADIRDNFMVELNFNNGFIYSTNSEGYCFFTSGKDTAIVSRSSSTGKLTAAPLVKVDVTLFLPCAKIVQTEVDKPLIVTFLSTYAGRESFDFLIR